MVNQMAILTTTILELNAKVHSMLTLPAKIDQLIEEINKLDKRMTVIETRVSTNEEALETIGGKLNELSAKQSISSPETTIAEVNDRILRSKNLMVFGLVESDDTDVKKRVEHE